MNKTGRNVATNEASKNTEQQQEWFWECNIVYRNETGGKNSIGCNVVERNYTDIINDFQSQLDIIKCRKKRSRQYKSSYNTFQQSSRTSVLVLWFSLLALDQHTHTGSTFEPV